MAPTVTVGVSGRAVSCQEVAVVSLPDFEGAKASLNLAAAVMAVDVASVLVSVVVSPAPLLLQAASDAV